MAVRSCTRICAALGWFFVLNGRCISDKRLSIDARVREPECRLAYVVNVVGGFTRTL